MSYKLSRGSAWLRPKKLERADEVTSHSAGRDFRKASTSPRSARDIHEKRHLAILVHSSYNCLEEIAEQIQRQTPSGANGRGRDKQMVKHSSRMVLALGAFCMSSAFGQTAMGVRFPDNGPSETRPASGLRPPVTERLGAGQPPAGGNPLWGIPMSELTATRERPLFIASRRPPLPPVAAQPMATPPPPAEPGRPPFALVGTVLCEPQNIALVQDQTTKKLARLRVGEATSGWFLRSIEARIITVEKNSQIATLALSGPGAAPAGPPAVAEAFRVGQLQTRRLIPGRPGNIMPVQVRQRQGS
jgi:hypothetical protein